VVGIVTLATAVTVGVVAFAAPGLLPGAAADATPDLRSVGVDHTAANPTATAVKVRPKTKIPGLGAQTRAKIPASSRQVIVVTGVSKTSNRSKVVLYQKTAQGWKAGTTWAARNGRKGWSSKHRDSDLRSPIGVYTLTDAGGLLPDVGTKLTYDRSTSFKITGNGMLGQPLEGSFNYVIAINYNRRVGQSPLDKVRPQGQSKGGGIWLHVRSDGPTKACISLTEAQMRVLLKTLDPARKPVIVMGDAASLRH
jgi:L,D-peptidoglycan transpeptidase YkuD (ErfK/YbiS/YcfS/YnhG family)